MDRNVQVLLLIMIAAVSAGNSSPVAYSETEKQRSGGGVNVTIVSREEWNAAPPKGTNAMKNPVPFVIIHHSYIPAACYTTDSCAAAMKGMQDMHMNVREWDDVGYSFAIGGDNRIYMGRGWNHVGAHAPHYNNQSIGICLIGDWQQEIPSAQVLGAAKDLIAYGVEAGHIRSDYQLFGHRQVKNDTECPGDKLFEEISTWPHFGETPPFKVYVKPS